MCIKEQKKGGHLGHIEATKVLSGLQHSVQPLTYFLHATAKYHGFRL